ncbi:MAG: 30S ribosomal protein S20 [Gemmatimonadetes bacterium 13_1_40CM_2_70_7]|nr:MAG: 30S ribosomal protein S20 [Gemmatimonadetes bacterium 13_1_40CM_2_70_7]
MRQGRAHAVHNRAQRSALRTAVKRVRAAASAAAAQEAYHAAVRVLDRAARRGLIHKNSAARHKARLAAAVKKVK